MRKTLLSLNDEQRILNEYVSGKAIYRIRSDEHIAEFRVIDILKNHGIAIRRSYPKATRYVMDESFFEAIDSEEKAYILGFIGADGHVTNQLITILLSQTDRGHLVKIISALKSNIKIYDFMAMSKGKMRPYSRITFHRKALVAPLSKFGMIGNKTSRLSAPNLDEKLMRHFWRGAIDGDGMIFRYQDRNVSAKAMARGRGKYWRIGFCGNQYMVGAFADFVAKKTQYAKKPVHCENLLFNVTYSGFRPAQTVTRLLYSDCTIFLDRKKQLADELMSTKAYRKYLYYV